jgi:DNA-binding CsgD family transcriptional regulator
MVAVTPLMHEIIPHGAIRSMLFEPDACPYAAYTENPETTPIWLAKAWRFVNDPTSPMHLYIPKFRAAGIGWTLHLQGRGWLDGGWYREVEAPTDSCWILDAMIGDAGQTVAGTQLTRPRRAHQFTSDDVQRLDRLRPWLAHAFRRRPPIDTCQKHGSTAGSAGGPVLSGQLILTPDTNIVSQTRSIEQLFHIIERRPADLTRYSPVRDSLPAPILRLLKHLNGSANGESYTPPRMQISSAYGVITLEAKWLVPADALPADIAQDPKGCLIAVTIELREHATAHAARILRESGATPAQLKVGLQLALGKTKRAIANELGIRPCSVVDLTRKLYRTLDVHNSAELGAKIWLTGPRINLNRGVLPAFAVSLHGRSMATQFNHFGLKSVKGIPKHTAPRA